MTDGLDHIRFDGRPAVVMPRPRCRTRLSSSAAQPAAARSSELPGQLIPWVFFRAGLAAESYRGEPLGRRLSACLRAVHANSEAQARKILEQRPELLPAAVNSLLIGVTDFFRDAPVFDALRREVLPRLASHRRPLRIWSAGCASGAELYSVAILLAEAGLLEGSFLFGTDCRCDAIQCARTASYRSSELRNIKPADQGRYFDEVGGSWRPIEPLRRQTRWQVADLSRCIEPGPWDIILWRNMAIYLRADAAASMWRGLASVLAPQGVLVVGKAERPPIELPLIGMKKCMYCAGDGPLAPRALRRPTRLGTSQVPERCV